jgi:hypothetical protein
MVGSNYEDYLVVLARALIREAATGATWLWRNFRRRLELPGDRKELLSSFLLSGTGEYLLHPGADYMPAPDQLLAPETQFGYPHNIEALKSFTHLLPEKTYYQQTILWETPLSLVSRVVSSGSPKDNALARQFLPFYQLSRIGLSLVEKTQLQPESIAYCFGEDLTAPRVNVVSKMRGGVPDKKTRKMLWKRTVDSRMQSWCPMGYEKGEWLEKDFLLVSRLPRNQTGGDILLFSGAHGAGTEATRLLLWELDIRQIRDLADAIGNAPYFQFVVEVDKVDHPSSGTVPAHVRISEELPPVRLQPKNNIARRRNRRRWPKLHD